ncbi:MAG: hypothetical protein A2174_00530 [Candidatus Portnoybacteria bacterium RBG_13_41_18]|uniref:Glycoside hydrolase family 5 domain-containing protein n=1 Tax=Candidatus Portnoybacteria bacterium RBG_13_41_18 TaxID=1801991 RepID=A0A1G2FAI5_9BACT|nr:MAG: hypothetical protein A2174_00530 [Candidatus Portnoybacteria bacterium RBG_13_41_18]
MGVKKLFTFLIIIAIIVGAVWYLSRETADPNRQIEWGVTFSQTFAQKLGLDWKKAYLEILDDLQIKKIRLIAYWPEIEPKEDLWDFRDLDWQIEEASKRDVKIILAVGQKLPRWPECHIPDWVNTPPPGLSDYKKVQLLKYIETTVSRYKNNPAIVVWEVENEPFLNFGECPVLDEKLLDEEIALVRKLDNRPIMVTDSGELSIWYYAAKRADIFGTTMYRWVWHKWLGSWKYPIPPAFFRVKERVVRLFVGQEKSFIVIELQGEPWGNKQIYEMTTDEQIKYMNFDEFKAGIEYAKQAGFNEYYLWGAEWWWALKQNGHEEYWEYVKELTRK